MDFKKLTAQEVASKRFTPVRMREGYSIDEVDEFLESVENTINAYNDEHSALKQTNEELRNKPIPQANPAELADLKARMESTLRELAEAQASGQVLQSTVEQMGTQLIEARGAVDAANAGRASAEAGKAAAEQAAVTARELAQQAAQGNTARPMDVSTASASVAKMLETAAKNYEDLVAEGEAESKRVRDNAEAKAAEVLGQAEREAAVKIAEVNRRVEELQAQAANAKDTMIAQIENEKAGLLESVTNLRAVETRAREQLIRVYSTSLNEIQAAPLATESGAGQPQVSTARRAAPPIEAHGNGSFGDMPSFNGSS